MPRYAKKNTIEDLKNSLSNAFKQWAKKSEYLESIVYDLCDIDTEKSLPEKTVFKYLSEIDPVKIAKCYSNELLSEFIIDSKDVKVDFDTENMCTPFDIDPFGDGVGFHQLDGFAIAMCAAGGDWEIPVQFCLYIDDKDKVRLYIPTDGNTFNPYTMTAFGSEYLDANDPMWNKFPKEWVDRSSGTPELNKGYISDNIIGDIGKMLNDIRSRIVVRD